MEKHNVSTTDISGCVRKVSPLERFFLWSPENNVSMITRILGDIDEERLLNALDMVRHVHPLVGAKIVFDANHDAWFSTDGVPEPNFKTIIRVSDKQWFEELQHEIQTPVNLETGPMIKFRLLYSEYVSDLIVICNHSICDGMSLVYLTRDLLNFYVNPEQNVKVLNPPNIFDLLPKENDFASPDSQRINYVNAQWKKTPHYFDHNDFNALQTAYWEKNQFGTVLLELDSPETKVLSKRCKDKGVTVGSSVTAAFIAAYEDVIGPFVGDKKQISIPFDLRRHATSPVDDIFCLCVGASRFPYNYNSKKSFWENALVLHNEIHERVKKLDWNGIAIPDFDPAFLDATSRFAPLKEVIPEAYSRTENLKRFSEDTKNIAFLIAKKTDKKSQPGVIPSNLGRINIPESYGDLQIDRMVFIPSGSYFVPLVLGGISICDKMVFSMNYPEPKNIGDSMTNEMIEIRNKALEYLGFSDAMSENTINRAITY
jgi:NRPS condensation-like uncharacterized protein